MERMRLSIEHRNRMELCLSSRSKNRVPPLGTCMVSEKGRAYVPGASGTVQHEIVRTPDHQRFSMPSTTRADRAASEGSRPSCTELVTLSPAESLLESELH